MISSEHNRKYEYNLYIYFLIDHNGTKITFYLLIFGKGKDSEKDYAHIQTHNWISYTPEINSTVNHLYFNKKNNL